MHIRQHQPIISPLRAGLAIALLLALAPAGLAGTPPAQAAPPSQNANQTLATYSMTVSPTSVRQLCVGATQVFYVRVRFEEWENLRSAEPTSSLGRPGETVDAAVVSAIGTISPPRQQTGAAPPPTGVDDDLVPLVPYSGTTRHLAFTFTARRAGSTTITFKHIAGLTDVPHAANAEANVRVVNCKFRERARAEWLIPAGFAPEFHAIVGEVQLVGDGQGHFTGSGSLSNAARPTLILPTCGITSMSASPSEVTVTGDQDPNTGELYLTASFTPVNGTATGTCPTVSANSTGVSTLETIDFTIPSSGGAILEPQTVTTYVSATTAVEIVIIPRDAGSAGS